ncbi:MAG: putative type-1 restriction enzyme specificity protein [Candidatus Ordinivivax streblomastigis]|uniref:Putative type-1 restriction enzyme specificity protein n=1 Tax=Candidatus Ordinivivax streblomastigis TaxID=2540710 RepID=A0A5M8P144_9BACT|nr:MAG: putative type-1 restriction enzyme specificity protein [Candidatus Ordinivivax streblomastigis]
MNKIEKLIQQHCPNGVEFKELGECLVKNIGGGTPSKAKSTYWNGSIPWASVKDIVKCGMILNETEDFITEEGLHNSPCNIVPKGEIIIITRINPGIAVIAGKNIAINQDLRGLFLKPFVNTKFLVFYFQTLKIEGKGTTVKGISIDELERIKIPIPPLPIQQEIVNILDKFTQLETELEVELETEIKARRAQYEHYRNALLTFTPPPLTNFNTIIYKTLGEIGMLIRGNGLQKKDFTESGIGCIHYGQIYTYYGTFADKTKSFVSSELSKKLQKVEKGDLILANTGENIEDICKAVAWLGDETIVTGGHSTIFKHSQNPKYLAYYFQTKDFFDQKRRIAKGTKVIEVAVKDLEKIRVPIPPIEEQSRIVAILDKFEALVNDISVGLPAEIKMRRQQYEYYRNKLLTFKEAA